jgi:protein-S-isoprenylcysteine O-methyltransferase Ste14
MGRGDWVFRFRFWLIVALFFAGFEAYSIDHINAVVRVIRWLGLPPGARRAALHVAFAAGAALCMLAAVLRTWAAAYLRSEVVHDSSLRSERLVADGPYRRVRNPLYLGSILLAASLGLLASLLGWIVLVVGMASLTRALISREERQLLESQGSRYRAYLDAVPAIVPSIRARLPAGGQPARWVQAFVGEAPMWIFAAALVAFAATLDNRVAFVFIWASLGLYAIQWAMGVRRPAL